MVQSEGIGNIKTNQAQQSGQMEFFSNPLMADTESDWSPIHDAAYNGRLLSLSRIIEQGASVNLVTLDQISPLHVACRQGHTACVKTLLEHGANVNISSINWNTPLSDACGHGNAACVDLLLRHGASTQGGSTTTSPIHQAAAKGHTECIESLLKYGVDIDQSTDQAGPPLYTACANQHLSTVKRLLQLGASVNCSKNGDSALHLAAQLSNPELVKTLLDHGADHKAKNKAGKLPVDIAPPNSAVVKLLKQTTGSSI
ncbi:ankyrin repeat and SOCS box protein 9-like [Sardina pilchardus]|uniref:ankyrin repeat and SOCS box protein 9-like n=1 Tax=Sardina pilchardus TaxID=27697 RepID=UPI002E118952